MRIVFIGASELTVGTARLLLEHEHEVVISETDRHRIDELTEQLDCAFLHGDGSKPHILQETNPLAELLKFTPPPPSSPRWSE